MLAGHSLKLVLSTCEREGRCLHTTNSRHDASPDEGLTESVRRNSPTQLLHEGKYRYEVGGFNGLSH
jgi:hypothetical protein